MKDETRQDKTQEISQRKEKNRKEKMNANNSDKTQTRQDTADITRQNNIRHTQTETKTRGKRVDLSSNAGHILGWRHT